MSSIESDAARERLNTRREDHKALSEAIAGKTPEELTELIASGEELCEGTGGKVTKIKIDEKDVIAKQLRLTDLERQPENRGSTANLFNLPIYYQYGVGSTGFGAQRELESHKMTTEWVLNGECPNFPLMYGSRELPIEPKEPMDAGQLLGLNQTVAKWGGSEAVRARLVALRKASSSITVFMEHIPNKSSVWIEEKIEKNSETLPSDISRMEREIDSTTSFMREKGFLHFDAHGWNILADNKQLYFADFGLAISSKFDLSREEREFFDKHQNYDKYMAMTYISDGMSGAYDRAKIDPPDAAAFIKKYEPIRTVFL